MINRRLTTGGLAIVLLIGLSGRVTHGAAGQQNRNDREGQYGGSLDARQHGYEHAYRDGADRGRQDRDRRTGYSLKKNDYQSSARGYEAFFGDRGQYIQGAREGYKAGYDDGYNGRAGRYGQIYGRPNGTNQAPVPDDVYAARAWGSADMAFDVGYRDGITAGQQDQGRHARSNYRDTDAYRNADLGYRTSYGDRDAYRLKFQDGFERGYQDAYGRYTGGVGTSGVRGNPSGSLMVPGNRQWTPTNIRVGQGEALRFQVNGEVQFTANANDGAGASGTPGKFVPGAPLPAVFAGALIGRIDNGRPFAIGDAASVRMPANGMLYLGVNDDNVSDNRGQFQVVISR